MARGTVAIAAFALAAAPPPPASDPIIVQARTAPMMRSYVDKAVKPEQGHQLARWNKPICLSIMGMADTYAGYIRKHFSVLADDLKVRLLPPGCTTNVFVKMTDRADALAKSLVEAPLKQIGNSNRGTRLPVSEIAAIEAPRTIRWMTSTETVSNDGVPFSDAPFPVNRLYSPSLIGSGVREDVDAELVLIDEAKLANVTLAQLADYIAFVVFTTPDLGADFSGTDSILALYPGGSAGAPARLTGRDRAFLAALYATPADRTAAQQKAAIRTKLRRGE